MREIKFRFWDKHLKLMFPVSYIDFDNEEVLYWLYDMDMPRRFDEVEIMQYTEFKDSDGAEIYEGDILQDTHDGLITGVVKMNDGMWQCDGNYLFDIADCHQVVGNMYENPEILKGE